MNYNEYFKLLKNLERAYLIILSYSGDRREVLLTGGDFMMIKGLAPNYLLKGPAAPMEELKHG